MSEKKTISFILSIVLINIIGVLLYNITRVEKFWFGGNILSWIDTFIFLRLLMKDKGYYKALFICYSIILIIGSKVADELLFDPFHCLLGDLIFVILVIVLAFADYYNYKYKKVC